MNKIKEIKSMSESDVLERLARIKQTFVGIPIMKGKDGYPYSLFTLTDFYPPMTPDLVEIMADLIIYYGNFEDADIVVSEADRGGGPIAHAVALRANLPYTLANWYPTESPGQISVEASIGFSGQGNIYLNGVTEKQNAILVDDLLSSGGTALALLHAIKKAGATPLQALFVAEKLERGGRLVIERNFDIPIVALIKFRAEGQLTTEA